MHISLEALTLMRTDFENIEKEGLVLKHGSVISIDEKSYMLQETMLEGTFDLVPVDNQQ